MGAPENAIFFDLHPDSPDLEKRLALIFATLRGADGAPPQLDVLIEAQRALRSLNGLAIPVLCDCLLELAPRFSLAGRADLALDAADDAITVARILNDTTRLLRGLINSSAASNLTLDYPGSIEKLAEATRLSKELNDPQLSAKVLVNLGVAHQGAGQCGSAMEAYEHVRRMSADVDALRYARECALNNVAFAALQVRDIEHGINVVQEAISAAKEPTTSLAALARVRLENTYVRLLIENRQYAEAGARARFAHDIATKFPSPVAMTLTRGAEALAAIARGDQTTGVRLLQQALDEARLGSQGDLRDMLFATVRGYQLAKQSDVALLYLKELTELNARVRIEQMKLHQRRHLQRVNRGWSDRLSMAELVQQREIEAEMQTAEMIGAKAAYLEKVSIGAELHDDETGFHVYRVGSMVRELAQAMGTDPQTCWLLELGARQHDIGKLAVPESIMNKPGAFEPEERAIMETHAAEGARIIRELSKGLPQMHTAEEIAHAHHEKWGGTGYPRRLKGTNIPFSARVTAVCDFYDAVTHPRVYRANVWTNEKVFQHMLDDKQKGVDQHFDPEIVDVFVKLVPQLIQQHGDLDAYLSAPGKNSSFINDRAAINRLVRGDSGAI